MIIFQSFLTLVKFLKFRNILYSLCQFIIIILIIGNLCMLMFIGFLKILIFMFLTLILILV